MDIELQDQEIVFAPITRVLKQSEKISQWLSYVGMFTLFVMMTLTFIDVLLRYIFGFSIPGTVEITALMMVVVVFSSMSYTQWQNSHVTMDIVTSCLEITPRYMLSVATLFWTLITLGVACGAVMKYGISTTSNTALLRISYKPFIFFTAFGIGMVFLAVLYDLLHKLHYVICCGKHLIFKTMLLSIVPVILIVYVALVKIPNLTTVDVGIMGIVFMFILFFLGVPIGFSLMATGLVFISQLRGIDAAIGIMGKALYATAGSYHWSPLMLFMLMGYFCFYGRFGEDLYHSAQRCMGHLRGGLAQGSVAACTAFGAVVGDTLAGSVAMSAIALPEMRKNGYSDNLSVGTLACSGTLGALIPPSSTFIIYAILAQQSIGDMFIAGIIPGILCMCCFFLIVWLYVYFKPEAAPRLEKASLADRLSSLKNSFPIILLFLVVIGGIYGGIFTATEGGGIGAFCTLLLGICMRRFSFKTFFDSMQESVKFISMCFTVLCGAIVLSYFMTLTRMPMLLANGIASLDMPSGMVMLAIIFAMLFLGCFLPSMPLLLICVPIFVPIAEVLGWNLIWFGIIITILDNLASVTPPFGINLFVMKEIAGVSLSSMYKASIPFVLGLLLCLGIIILFPELSTWLLSQMKS